MTEKGLYGIVPSHTKVNHLIMPLYLSLFCLKDVKVAKPEASLMSLLNTFDGFDRDTEEKEEVKDTQKAPPLPRTNSLEDLGIKVKKLFITKEM